MKHSTSVLGAALLVSLLVNVALLTRGRPRPAPPPAAKPAARSEGTSTSSSAADELARERALTLELRETVKRLEEEKSVLAQAATTPGAPPAPAGAVAKASVKDKLRKLKKIFKSADDGLQPDQEAVLEMSGELMELMKLASSRGKDPKTYAEFLEAVMEISLEDEAALTPEQKSQMAALLDGMAEELGRVRADSGVERLLRELEIESSAMGRLKELLTPGQKELLTKGSMDDVGQMSAGMSTSYLQKSNAAEMIVKGWTQAYKLSEAQLPAARAAAQSYARELESQGVKTFSPGDYAGRITSLRAQLNALKALEGALGAEQRERLRTQSPREFLLMDFPVVEASPQK